MRYNILKNSRLQIFLAFLLISIPSQAQSPAQDEEFSNSQSQIYFQYLQPIEPPKIQQCFRNGKTPNWKFCELKSIMPNQEIVFESIAQQGILLISCKGKTLQGRILATPPEKSRIVTFHHPIEQNKKETFKVEEIHEAILILDNQKFTRWMTQLDKPEFAISIGDSSDPPEIRFQQRFSWPGIQEVCFSN